MTDEGRRDVKEVGRRRVLRSSSSIAGTGDCLREEHDIAGSPRAVLPLSEQIIP